MSKEEPKEPVKILSVEDDEFIRLFLNDVLWIHGVKDNLNFATAETTGQARILIQNPSSRPDLILLDLMLPTGDGGKSDLENGISLLEEIKTDPDLMKIKVIVFSSIKDVSVRERVLRLGAERFMIKGDYMPTELIDAVRDVLGQTKKEAS